MVRKLPGRPAKKDSERAVARGVSMDALNDRYILEILRGRQHNVRGNYSKVINEIVSRDRRNAVFKATEASKHLKRLEELGVDVSQVRI